MDIQINFMTLV